MDNKAVPPHRQLISIPIGQFNARLTQLARVTDPAGQLSMHSRLSLIHQTAKLYAAESAQQAGCTNPVIDIDELTNPPLLDLPIDPDDGQQVLIRFTY